MKKIKVQSPPWFFIWYYPKAKQILISSICDWTRRDLILKIEATLGDDWKNIRKKGGRAVKVTITIVDGDFEQ